METEPKQTQSTNQHNAAVESTERENRIKQKISHKVIYCLGTLLQISVNEERLLIIAKDTA